MTTVLKFASDVTVKNGVITVALSTEGVDRDGDIVRSTGWDLSNFTKAPRLMSCHDYGDLRKQIGEWRNVRVDPQRKALIGEPHYYTDQGNPEADWAAFLASKGQATYSVGFSPIEDVPRKGVRGGSEYLRQELLECSHVPIPSNPEALQLMAKAFASRQPVEKAGKPISGANMGQLHTLLQAGHALHDPNCTADDCPLDDDDGDPPTNRDKRVRRAASEGDGGSGGLLCPFCHPKSAVDASKADCNCKGDCGESKCPKADDAKALTIEAIQKLIRAELEAKSHSELPDTAFACIDPGGTKEGGKTTPLSLRHYPHHTASGAVDDGLLRSALSRIADPSDEQCGKAHLEAHAKAEGIGDSKAFDWDALIERQVTQIVEAL